MQSKLLQLITHKSEHLKKLVKKNNHEKSAYFWGITLFGFQVNFNSLMSILEIRFFLSLDLKSIFLQTTHNWINWSI